MGMFQEMQPQLHISVVLQLEQLRMILSPLRWFLVGIVYVYLEVLLEQHE